jgi:hypothetical protein
MCVRTGAHDGDARSAALEPSAVRRRVDAESEAAHDGEARIGKRVRERLRVAHALRGCISAADDREARRGKKLEAAAHV